LAKKIFTLPGTMLRVCLVQFFSWFAWFTFLIYITNWTAENVFGGSSQEDPAHPELHELYLQGVQWGSFGLAGFALVSLLTSPFVPKLISIFGHRLVWCVGQTCLVVSLASTYFVTNRYVALAVISSFGLPWSVSMTVPFALTAILSPREETGVYMGILNIFVVIPQLIMAGLGPLIIHLAPKQNVAFPMMCGAIAAFISCFLVWIVRVKPDRANGNDTNKPVIFAGGH